MKKIATKLSMFALAGMVVIGACKDDDSDSCDNGSFEMTLNGDPVSGKSFNNTLLKWNDAGEAGKRMDIRATDDQGREVIITFTDNTTGSDGNGVTTEDVYVSMDDTMSPDDNTAFASIYSGDDQLYLLYDGELDITACDASKKQVSGTFSFNDGENEISGTFTNMCYRIMNQ